MLDVTLKTPLRGMLVTSKAVQLGSIIYYTDDEDNLYPLLNNGISLDNKIPTFLSSTTIQKDAIDGELVFGFTIGLIEILKGIQIEDSLSHTLIFYPLKHTILNPTGDSKAYKNEDVLGTELSYYSTMYKLKRIIIVLRGYNCMS